MISTAWLILGSGCVAAPLSIAFYFSNIKFTGLMKTSDIVIHFNAFFRLGNFSPQCEISLTYRVGLLWKLKDTLHKINLFTLVE